MHSKRPVALRSAPGGGMFLAWSNLDARLELVHIANDGEMLLDRILPEGVAFELNATRVSCKSWAPATAARA